MGNVLVNRERDTREGRISRLGFLRVVEGVAVGGCKMIFSQISRSNRSVPAVTLKPVQGDLPKTEAELLSCHLFHHPGNRLATADTTCSSPGSAGQTQNGR